MDLGKIEKEEVLIKSSQSNLLFSVKYFNIFYMKEQRNYYPYIVICSLCLLCSMLEFISFDALSFSFSLPSFGLMTIFYFAVYRKVVSVWLIFIAGLIVDSFSGSFLGLTSLSYILTVRMMQNIDISPSSEGHIFFLKFFSAFIAIVLFMKLVLSVIFTAADFDLLTILYKILISSVLYVVIHKALDAFYKKYFHT